MKVLAAVVLILVAQLTLGPAEAQQQGAPVAVVSMTPVTISEPIRNLAQAAQGGATALALIVGGIWSYRKFVLQQEKYPHIETSADINFIGKHKEYWVIEIIAWVENKGTAQHRMSAFDFDLYHLLADDTLEEDARFGGQVAFPHCTKKGSLIPTRYSLFFVDPGVKAKYSYITKVPAEATMLIFHWSFKYADGRGYGHTAEITKRIPKGEAEDFVQPHPDLS